MLTLEDVKAAISVTHDDDNMLILRLMDSAARECALTIYGTVPDYTAIGAVADPQTVQMLKQGIILMVQSDYEGDPTKRNEYLTVAKALWNPYRTIWGL